MAQKLVAYIKQKENHPEIIATPSDKFSPFSTDRRETYTVGNIGGDNLPVVISDRSKGNFEFNVHFLPDYLYVGKELPLSAPRAIPSIIDLDGWKGEKNTYPLFDKSNWEKIRGNDATIKFLRLSYPELDNNIISLLKADRSIVIILTTNHINGVGEQRAFIHTLMNNDCDTPVIPNRRYEENEMEDLQIKAATDFGTLYLDGFGNGIMLENQGSISLKNIDAYMFGILQASRIRTSKTEYISCPSCGRTLFDLQTTVALVKDATSHLKHLKIGVMGCIVNGPGEMADADYGYVGAEKGKISLYKRKNLIEKNIASEEAVERLVQLIKDNGDWMEPEN